MNGVEIAVFAAGIVLILLSFILFREKESVSEDIVSDNLILNENIRKLKKDFSDELSEMSSEAISETDAKLSKMSNETIIEVNDFTNQLFAKLNNNHDEIVFLYNMLQDKEADIKTTLERMEVLRKENQKSMDNKSTEALQNNSSKIAESSTMTEAAAASDGQKKAGGKTLGRENTESHKSSKGSGKNKNRRNDSLKYKNAVSEQVNEPVNEQEAKREKILALYRDKMSVIEISKALGLGQGEVKLIIDLYGK